MPKPTQYQQPDHNQLVTRGYLDQKLDEEFLYYNGAMASDHRKMHEEFQVFKVEIKDMLLTFKNEVVGEINAMREELAAS